MEHPTFQIRSKIDAKFSTQLTPSTDDEGNQSNMIQHDSTPGSTDDEDCSGMIHSPCYTSSTSFCPYYSSSASIPTESSMKDFSDELTLRVHYPGFFNHPDVKSIVSEVLRHYSMERCLISLTEPGGKCTKAACYRMDTNSSIQFDLVTLPVRSRLCKMEAKRNLPTIIDDAHLHKTLCNDPLVVAPSLVGLDVMRFFMEVPLIRPMERYCGVICLADCLPRQRFPLHEANMVMSKRDELVSVLDKLGF
jgi:hypothetical protein